MSIRFDYLGALLALMERVPDDRVQMQEWEVAGQRAPFNPENLDCGFAGCGIGWCITAEIVPGLVWGLRGPFGRRNPVYYAVPGGQAEWDWHGIQDAFGISHEQALHLFHAEKYVPRNDPRYVQDSKQFAEACKEFATRGAFVIRLRAFIESGGVVPQ